MVRVSTDDPHPPKETLPNGDKIAINSTSKEKGLRKNPCPLNKIKVEARRKSLNLNQGMLHGVSQLAFREGVKVLGKNSNQNQKTRHGVSQLPLRLGVELGGFEPPTS